MEHRAEPQKSPSFWFIFLINVPFIPLLGLINAVLSIAIDFQIAAMLGGVRNIPKDVPIWGGGQEFGEIGWTFSSVIGVFMTGEPPDPGFILAIVLSGLFPVWLAANIVSRKEKPFGNYYWLIWSIILFWAVRIPVPLERSLFYWTAVRF